MATIPTFFLLKKTYNVPVLSSSQVSCEQKTAKATDIQSRVYSWNVRLFLEYLQTISKKPDTGNCRKLGNILYIWQVLFLHKSPCWKAGMPRARMELLTKKLFLGVLWLDQFSSWLSKSRFSYDLFEHEFVRKTFKIMPMIHVKRNDLEKIQTSHWGYYDAEILWYTHKGYFGSCYFIIQDTLESWAFQNLSASVYFNFRSAGIVLASTECKWL